MLGIGEELGRRRHFKDLPLIHKDDDVGVSCEPGLPSDWELPNPTADSQVKQVSTRSSAMSSPLAHAGIHHAVQRAGYQVAGEHEGGGE